MADNKMLDFGLNSIGFNKSSLEITGSCGVEFTSDILPRKPLNVGLTIEAFQITDHKNNRKVWLSFTGIGAGASVGKSLFGQFSISASTPDFWSMGSYIYGGPLNWGDVEIEELYGKDVLIYTGSLSARQGGGITLIFVGPMPQLPFPLAWHSRAAVIGLSMSSSYGIGLMQYYGLLTPPVA